MNDHCIYCLSHMFHFDNCPQKLANRIKASKMARNSEILHSSAVKLEKSMTALNAKRIKNNLNTIATPSL